MTKEAKQLAAFSLIGWIREQHPDFTVEETFELLEAAAAGLRVALREMSALAASTKRKPQ